MYQAALEGGEMPGGACEVQSAECGGEGSADAEQQTAPTELPVNDPFAMAYELEAWMPDAIATHKLRGFVEDAGGEVVESVPGRILVRLGTRGSVYFIRGGGPLGWLGLGNRNSAIDMELSLQRLPDAANLVRIMVKMRSSHGKSLPSDSLRERCGQVFCDLRAYLMGQGVSVG
jgi:serine/threonine-protein kinase